MSENICKRYYVAGRVQGVFFRARTAEEGRRLGLQGWVRNLPDGRVEVVACGSPESVSELGTWLTRGPSLAKVTRVDVNLEEPSQCESSVRPVGAIDF